MVATIVVPTTAPTAMPALVAMSWMLYAEPEFAIESRCKCGCEDLFVGAKFKERRRLRSKM